MWPARGVTTHDLEADTEVVACLFSREDLLANRWENPRV
jgi:hypothetical protein